MNALGVLVGIAFAHLRVRVRQTIVAVLGVVVGVGLFLSVSSAMMGTQNDMVATMIDTAPHIIVRDERRTPSRQPVVAAFPDAAVQVRGVRPQEEVRGLKDWPAMLAEARATPGAVAAASLSGAVSIGFAGRTEAVALNGIDPRLEGQLTKIEGTLRGGSLIDLESRPDGIIVSRALAERLGARLGDTLIVTSTAGVLQRMRILALIESGGLEGFYAGDNTAYGLLRTAQVLFARPSVVNQIHVKIPNPYDAQRVARTLESRWGYTWESWQERSADLLNLLIPRTIITYVVVSAILLVASFGIYTSVSTSVNEKRRDIAIMRAMGFTPSDVQIVFVLEGLAVGLVGAAGGFALGTSLLEALANAPISVEGQAFALPLDRGWGQYAIAGTVALGSAAFASWLPARRASRVDPVDILRGAA